MTMTQLLNCLGTEIVTVERFTKTKLVGGKHKASKMPTFKIKASVQPVSGREKDSLPEGIRQKYVVKLYVEKELLVSDDQNKQRADLIYFDNEAFEVAVVEKHRGLGLDHFVVFAARRNK